jgi:hypothetical protein
MIVLYHNKINNIIKNSNIKYKKQDKTKSVNHKTKTIINFKFNNNNNTTFQLINYTNYHQNNFLFNNNYPYKTKDTYHLLD